MRHTLPSDDAWFAVLAGRIHVRRENVITMAKASWALPLVAFVLNMATASQGKDIQFSTAMVGVGMYVLALLLGIAALIVTLKDGLQGVMKHAIIGILLSGTLVAGFVYLFMVVLPNLKH